MKKYLISYTQSIEKDGWYTIYQLAVPKESIKDETRAIATNNYYVKNDGLVYTIVNTEEVQIDLYNLCTTTDLSNTNILMTATNVISQCLLKKCFASILEQFSKYYSDPTCIKDNMSLKLLRDKRDLLFSVIVVIGFYANDRDYYNASKLIYDVTFCNICKNFIESNPNLNCNCNG